MRHTMQVTLDSEAYREQRRLPSFSSSKAHNHKSTHSFRPSRCQARQGRNKAGGGSIRGKADGRTQHDSVNQEEKESCEYETIGGHRVLPVSERGSSCLLVPLGSCSYCYLSNRFSLTVPDIPCLEFSVLFFFPLAFPLLCFAPKLLLCLALIQLSATILHQDMSGSIFHIEISPTIPDCRIATS